MALRNFHNGEADLVSVNMEKTPLSQTPLEFCDIPNIHQLSLPFSEEMKALFHKIFDNYLIKFATAIGAENIETRFSRPVATKFAQQVEEILRTGGAQSNMKIRVHCMAHVLEFFQFPVPASLSKTLGELEKEYMDTQHQNTQILNELQEEVQAHIHDLSLLDTMGTSSDVLGVMLEYRSGLESALNAKVHSEWARDFVPALYSTIFVKPYFPEDTHSVNYEPIFSISRKEFLALAAAEAENTMKRILFRRDIHTVFFEWMTSFPFQYIQGNCAPVLREFSYAFRDFMKSPYILENKISLNTEPFEKLAETAGVFDMMYAQKSANLPGVGEWYDEGLKSVSKMVTPVVKEMWKTTEHLEALLSRNIL